ncbi:VOC family protein [Mycolicibacterium brumae]|uniref:Glyoxalase/bleomycin resistance/dioxygenase family protein n=1 Tax=Mycolicibacterium brumae TaxID=85968 RepID=A0A2G5P970_9MYCO|nr:VOC family protein [Mycolicibacterium brumae]MCV7193959.1 VOC family protein [Mycolicibacterium brumae]PIB74911.1 glyoxalase/bleomycin resistance/dioxygenase family protein [Mycolicibacterium brumae]RWA22464.1 hypothetical protein MBRU_12845 [Mycolicibacterium brumae DSM 44177]UWW08008.1 VOC family protein [Mycolicibacterium brumae]
MALHWKLVIDCTDANAIADFWAHALGYQVEDPSALIEHLLSERQLPESAVAEHGGGKRFAGLAAVRHPHDPFDAFSGVGHGRRILFQQISEPKAGKNRLHIDVHDDGGDLDALVLRLEQLGATRVGLVDQGPAGRWWVMRDPEGNEFCACG